MYPPSSSGHTDGWTDTLTNGQRNRQIEEHIDKYYFTVWHVYNDHVVVMPLH